MGHIGKALAALMLLVLLASFLAGQGQTARILGNVSNEDNEYLRGALVTLTNEITNGESTTTTGKKKGAFRFVGLFPGTYQVSVDLQGYQSYVASGIRISAEQSVNLRIKLKKSPDTAAQPEDNN